MRIAALVAVLVAGAGLSATAAERRPGHQMAEGTPVPSRSSSSTLPRAAARAASAGDVRSAGTGAPQAPVLLQLYRQGTLFAGYAQAVADLPKGTLMTLFLITPDGKQTRNTTYRYDDGIPSGDWYKLPEFRDFGPLWTSGIYVLDLWVETPDGKTSHCLADFTVRYTRTPDEFAQVTPLITSFRLDRSSGKPILIANGNFLSEKPLALMEDWVVPQDAITSWTATQIQIDLSAIPNFPANDFGDFLLTIGQGGASDTYPVRITP